MCLDKALDDLSNPDRQRAEEELVRFAALSALTFQAVENFRVESRVGRKCWASLLQNLSVSSSIAASCAPVTTVLRTYMLKGPIITPISGTRFGRAVTLRRFCNLLVTLGYYATISSAHRAVRNMIGKPLPILMKYWRHFQLGRYVMWSTFNPARVTEPFEGVNGSADEIRGILGLDRNEAGLPLLLFEYDLRISVRFPTVAEAYASGTWPYFFRPAPRGFPHGMTMPWPEFEHRQPRPEVVHEVIDVSSMASPIRKVNEPTTH